jgi:DNA-binding transcriptional LysR family regulator
MQNVSWDEFRLVKAIAESGSLAGAGDILDLNHSTVFRRLNALELELGSRLFERARAGYLPTPAGEEMVALAERMFDDITDFERRISGRDVKPTGELRITTNDSFVAHLLTPLFGEFCKVYPEIKLDVVIENRALNLSKRDADVAIRATAEPPETLMGRRIASIAWMVYGLKSANISPIDDLSELQSHTWVGFGEALSNMGAARWVTRTVQQSKIFYRLNTVLGLSQAVEAGIGIGFLPCFIGDQSPNLKRLLSTPMVFDTSLWLLTHPDLKNSARVRAFVDFMGKELMKRKAMIEGSSKEA